MVDKQFQEEPETKSRGVQVKPSKPVKPVKLIQKEKG